jgi:hypothetical protein
MPVHSVKYSFFRVPPTPAFPEGRVIARPLIFISLVSGKFRLSCYALVDSGADQCVFPLSFAFELGLSPFIAPSEPIGGLGSSNVPAYFCDVVVELPGLTSFPLRAGFTEGLNHWGIGLLGQDGFFNRFRVNFRLNREADFEIEIP